MAGFTLLSLVATCFLVSVYADVYMQNPRGSNNRVNGQGRNRNNANRLFDSQNNARGGYNAGGLYYHVGSELTIEWTNQHSCSGPNNHCNLVLQYMCDDRLRNGVNERTIGFPKKNCENDDCNTDLEQGMHEPYEYYEHCFTRKRNHGLYTADQNMDHRTTARFTRQDNNGNRYGYECPEERDYYPYWHPTPWKDIAIMTSDISRCDEYKAESQNVKDKWICNPTFDVLPDTILNDLDRYFRRKPVPQTEDECKSYSYIITRDGKSYTVTAKWEKVAKHGIPPPECIKAPQSRDNHLGNGLGGFANTYNWTIPNDVHENCALRLRYNISTGDMPYDVDYKSNGRNKNNQACKACAINLGDQVGIDEWDAQDRGFILTRNPDVLPMAVDGEVLEKFELKLAVDTSQFGRTFEDRSHTFEIKARPANIASDAKIYNMNVRGKRGNIVQTYPATEYDFVPNRLTVGQGDYIHIQWTGSDNNPRNNAGQGEAGSDRSNMILLNGPQYPAVINAKADAGVKFGHWANSYPEHLKNASLLGLSYDDQQRLAFAGPSHGGDIEELNEHGPYFDLGFRQCNKVGVFRYLCTRNNNFTNRGQKGVIVVVAKGSSKKDASESFRDEAEDAKDVDEMIEEQLEKDMMMAGAPSAN